MALQDVAFLSSQASLPTHCGRGKSLGTTICLKTVVGGTQGHAPSRICSLQQSLFFASVEFHGDHNTVTTLR